jgi:tetratricopeptide (TPR) repeat protein
MRAAAFAWSLALAFGAMSACARQRPAVIVPPPDVTARLDAADASMRAGCFDCLADALREYDAIRSMPNLRQGDADAAATGAIRAALLLDLRERELGTTDDGYLWRAREVIGSREDLRARFAPYAETVDSIPWRVGRYDIPTDPESLRRMQALRANFPALLAERRAHADEDVLSAYAWMAFFCAHGSNREDRSPEALVAPLSQNRDTPIVGYRSAICGMGASAGRLERVLESEPRFSEIDFWLGELALGRGRLEEAESRLSRAYAWRQRWPALTVALGHVYFAFEEPARALQFYDETLALSEAYPDALIGRVKALSVTGKHADAFAVIDEILNGSTRVFPGEAHYWRAWNDMQVGQIDEAEKDITQAEKLWVNSEVSKLGGIIAYRRRLLTTARERFESARKLAPDDCENVFYLGNVQSELREWAVSADSFGSAVACIERAQEALRRQIAQIEASTWSEERKTQHIARREQQLASATRMIATSWFNMAAAHYNLGHKDDARQFAQRVVDDEQFAERAKEILSLLR